MAHKLTVAILGLPGAGKSTLCRGLEARFGWHCFLLGEALRDRAARDGELAELLGRGEMAPEAVVLDLVSRAAVERRSDVLLLDGFPRHPDQLPVAKNLFRRLVGLVLEVPRELASQRLAARRNCASCGWTGTLAPEAEGRCPACGCPALAGRPEDAPEVLTGRLSDAGRRLAALLEAWGEVPLVRVNSDAGRDTVLDEASNRIQELGG